MIKKELIALLAMLVVITACGSQTATSPTAVGNGSGVEQSNNGPVVVAESNLDYCKMILKTLQAQVNTFDRQEKTIKANIDKTKATITELKAKSAAREAIEEEELELNDLNGRLKSAQADLADAKKKLTDANAKCTKIAKKGDKAICNEFREDLQDQTKDAQTALAKEEANLENIKKQYDAAKAAGKTTPFLVSIDEEKQKKNLDILKVKNNIDKLGQMLVQLEGRC
ncbi:MAG TPA: hypothetical protein VJH37_02340 [Candidatus Nanoarchaeia archaeon]|nr:hypothetical protein [Candidatus Nanoarchaeia archaeon]